MQDASEMIGRTKARAASFPPRPSLCVMGGLPGQANPQSMKDERLWIFISPNIVVEALTR
ncbi:hypothetical protein A2U01_0007799 [Trifolium medium]|uniref:Uncharacterized protein n=1 Tax=Trifolium medium TaxID=97028 RepID=A0A392MHF1_9FABA|nr:hypothetical protein [Trifolium medium]